VCRVQETATAVSSSGASEALVDHLARRVLHAEEPERGEPRIRDDARAAEPAAAVHEHVEAMQCVPAQHRAHRGTQRARVRRPEAPPPLGPAAREQRADERRRDHERGGGACLRGQRGGGDVRKEFGWDER
jgi:hypothetical protein